MRTLRTAALFALSLAALSCGGKQTTGATTPAPAPPPPPAAAPAPAPPPPATDMDFSGWKSWTRLTKKPFLSRGHGKQYVDVYVDPKFADVYRSGTRPVPVGFRVMVPAYRDAGATEPSAITAMEKMEKGYDPDDGDWYYGVYTFDGKTAETSGKITSCINCHVQAGDTDYLFGPSRIPGEAR